MTEESVRGWKPLLPLLGKGKLKAKTGLPRCFAARYDKYIRMEHMAYSNDENLERFIPDILDHGVPAIMDGGVSTTLASGASAGAGSITVADASGLAAGDYLKLDGKSNVEIVRVGSVETNTITLDEDTPLRKSHKAGVKAVQADSPGFAADHIEAMEDIDRIIEVKWFKPRVRERYGRDIEFLSGNLDFDPDLMLNAGTQLRKASVYRVLGAYVCPKLSKATRSADSWEKRAEEFNKRFDEEIERVLSAGIDYDWDRSGEVEDDENRIPTTTFYVGRA